MGWFHLIVTKFWPKEIKNKKIKKSINLNLSEFDETCKNPLRILFNDMPFEWYPKKLIFQTCYVTKGEYYYKAVLSCIFLQKIKIKEEDFLLLKRDQHLLRDCFLQK